LNEGLIPEIQKNQFMMLRFLLFWLPMPVIAIFNAGIREKDIAKFLPELTCHQLSPFGL
jgi:hypothetical protein